MEFDEPINIVWLKRDLRLQDHEPLQKAIDEGLPLLLIFLLEPSVKKHADWDIRHWKFAYYSIKNLNETLEKYDAKIHILSGETLDIFQFLVQNYTIQTVFSSQETGNQITYQRDLKMSAFFEENEIQWLEFQTNGVIRALEKPKTWNASWLEKMNEPLAQPNLEKIQNVPFELPIQFFMELMISRKLSNYSKNFQPAGETSAHKYLDSFIKKRSKNYVKYLSEPQKSQKHNSRLSPYLAWGNLSVRQVYQVLQNKSAKNPLSDDLSHFQSRLHWRCHAIQKFESEERIEFENLNPIYTQLLSKKINKKHVLAWQKGETGFPLIDASMKCVLETGYLNFRMRAVLVSFLTHLLWQPWKSGVNYLAQQFLDYEIGIHLPHFQAQAGITGIHQIRIYHPIRESLRHDSEGVFIKKWLPILRHIPAKCIHKPYEMTALEQKFYRCEIGKDYPKPIIDFKLAYRNASTILNELKKHEAVKTENRAILKRHVSANPKIFIEKF